MDINKIVMNAIIEIEPPQTTAWSRPSKAENIGKLNQGEKYKVHKIHLDSGLIELDMPASGWPATLHPVASGGVWVDARFVKLPGNSGGTIEPQPATGKTWQGVVLAACKAVVAYLEG
jgi:hypothetical protein